MNNKNEIMIYEDKDGITKVNVKFINEDIWLTQNQLAEIYKTTQQNISQHINSIYKDNELTLDSTNKKFLLVQKEGNFATVQNKLHFAVHERTAAELIYDRVDNEKPYAPDVNIPNINNYINGITEDKNGHHFGENYNTNDAIEYMKKKVNFQKFFK